MKKIDYYAVQNPWRMPKWLGAALGGIFSVIALGSAMAIVHLTRGPAAPVAAVTAAPAIAPVPAAAAPVAATHESATTATVASADEATPAPSKKHGGRHHGSSHASKSVKLASAKHAPASTMDAGKRTAMLAKHDSKEKRHEKDALDKLLGL